MRSWLLVAALIATPALADQITADRPGIGIDPETVPQWTLQPEIGTDGREVRFGVLKGLEINWQRADGDSAESVKLSVIDKPVFKASLRAAYDQQLHGVIELPANITIASWFNLGLDAMWSRTSKVYAGEFNFAPTSRLTITPTVYHDDKARGAIFVAWVPPGHDNWQFDVGLDQGKVSAGISLALDLARLVHRK